MNGTVLFLLKRTLVARRCHLASSSSVIKMVASNNSNSCSPSSTKIRTITTTTRKETPVATANNRKVAMRSSLPNTSTTTTTLHCSKLSSVSVQQHHEEEEEVVETGEDLAWYHNDYQEFEDTHGGHLYQTYKKMAAEKEVQIDPIQIRALQSLDSLREQLLQTKPMESNSNNPFLVGNNSTDSSENQKEEESSFFGGFFGSSSSSSTKKADTPPAMKKELFEEFLLHNNVPKGIYAHGGVGCGKTFLMNIFYDSIDFEPWCSNKQKVHFHKFMLNVHQQMHKARYHNNGNNKDKPGVDTILPYVIEETLKQGKLLCFDEFQVTDVADALILQRLFEGLWANGCIVIATSNRPPDDLYLNGLQRDRFVPFIDLLKKQCSVLNMNESVDENEKEEDHVPIDYRSLIHQGGRSKNKQVFYSSVDRNNDEFSKFDQLFYKLTNGGEYISTQATLTTQGRKVKIPLSCPKTKICRFTFNDLCTKALGAADYLAISENYNTIFIEKIPKLSLEHINWIRRFIIFVDTMYENRVKLVIHSDTKSPREIFTLSEEQKKDIAHDEVFAFDRTLSRLEEMSSDKYLRKPWLGGGK